MPVGLLALDPGSCDITSHLILTVTVGECYHSILQKRKLRSFILAFVLY